MQILDDLHVFGFQCRQLDDAAMSGAQFEGQLALLAFLGSILIKCHDSSPSFCTGASPQVGSASAFAAIGNDRADSK